MINQIINSTLSKYHIDNIPIVKEMLEVNKEIIKAKLLEYKEKYPNNRVILIGTSAMQMHGLLYKPIKDIDLALIEGDLMREKIPRIDMLDWRRCGYTIKGWEERIVTIDNIEILSVRDILITFAMNLHRPNKIDSITAVTKYNNDLKEQALLDVEEFKSFSKRLGKDNPKAATFLESMDKFKYVVSNDITEQIDLELILPINELSTLTLDEEYKNMIRSRLL